MNEILKKMIAKLNGFYPKQNNVYFANEYKEEGERCNHHQEEFKS